MHEAHPIPVWWRLLRMLRVQLERMLWMLWLLDEMVQRSMLSLGVASDPSYYQQ